MSVTIKDVAKESGVSVSTVSKVLNGSPTISEPTIQKVQAVMERLHYSPNAQARRFATQTTHTIVFLTMCKKHEAFTNPHMFEILCGAQDYLASKGYSLLFQSAPEAEGAYLLAKQAEQGKLADGMIVHGSATSRALVSFLVQEQFPHILIGKPNFESSACWIDTNQVLSGETATEHLWSRGYRRIAFVGGGEKESISAQRLKGAAFALANHGAAMPQEYVCYGDSSKESGFDLACKLLELRNPPSAIICENNNIALGVVQAIRTAALRIPEDVAIVCFDDFPLSRLIDPSPTVVDINVYDMGVQAASTLLQKIKKPALQVQSYTTLPTLIIRSTT